jgi:hypothetical protein
MAEITYTVTTAQMNEIKTALQFHQGGDSTPTDADVKAWGLRHFQALVQKHREHVIATESPVGTSVIAT